MSVRMTKNANGVKSAVDAASPNETTTLRSKLETFDDILPYVGDFGRYQRLLLLSLLPYSVAYATLYFSQFFLTLVPQEHWCRTEELVLLNLTQEERYKIAWLKFRKLLSRRRRISRRGGGPLKRDG